MKKILLILFIISSLQSYGQVKVGSSIKFGTTLANFTDGPDTIKSKLDYDFGIEVFARLSSKWSVDLEWDNCTYGTRTHNPDKTRRLRLHLYYANFRITSYAQTYCDIIKYKRGKDHGVQSRWNSRHSSQ